ncbi:MAG TPA: hypothetical protein PKB06_08655, partial [Actinotalea sp.]|nr:hypothetical protein [Actinotalea sp.]
LVEVVVTRSADMRAAMAVAHEMRRAAGDQHAADLLRAIEAMHADADRPGSFAHAVHELRSRAGLAPQRIVAALTEVLGEHRAELRREPGVCARIVFSVVSSSFHDPLGATEQLPAHEVVEVLLHGLLARPSHPEAPC